MLVLLRQLDRGLPVPHYAHDGDAGIDLYAARGTNLRPGQRTRMATGVAVALPVGYAGFIHPRSGLAARHGLTIVNAPGTIDSTYRGEIQVVLLNTDTQDAITIGYGDRIAQLIVQRVESVEFVVTDELPATDRGSSGFGSTGGGMVSACYEPQ